MTRVTLLGAVFSGPGPCLDPGPGGFTSDHEAALLRLAGELPADQRDCIRLQFGQGLSVEETAATLRRPVAAVTTLTQQGLARLRTIATTPVTGPCPAGAPAVDPIARARNAVTAAGRRRADRPTVVAGETGRASGVRWACGPDPAAGPAPVASAQWGAE